MSKKMRKKELSKYSKKGLINKVIGFKSLVEKAKKHRSNPKFGEMVTTPVTIHKNLWLPLVGCEN